MINRTKTFYLPLLIVLGLLISVSCKEKTEPVKTKSAPQEDITQTLSPEYSEIVSFMGLSVSDNTDIDKLLVFKALYPKDSLADSDADKTWNFTKEL